MIKKFNFLFLLLFVCNLSLMAQRDDENAKRSGERAIVNTGEEDSKSKRTIL